MAKKESAERGYMTRDEIRAHVPQDGTKIAYLDKILKRKGLLSPKTREEVSRLEEEYLLNRAGNTPSRDNYVALAKFYENGGGGEGRRAKADLYRSRATDIEKGWWPEKDWHKDPWNGLYASIATVAILSGIFFLSSNVTGNVISNLSNITSSWIGGVLFCIGLVSCFFWVKSRKR